MDAAENANKRSSRRIGSWLGRVLLVCALALLCAAIAIGVWFRRTVLDGLPTDLSALDELTLPTACRVLDRNGDAIDSFYFERRWIVPLDELPAHLIDAVIASEDSRFWEHRGVDVRGVARAGFANLLAGRRVQGGSTITQQVVKNLLVGGERTYVRKLKEAVLALRLERALGKRAVLEKYLNFVFLGSGNYGVEAGALDDFGVSARSLDVGQAATLVGLIPAPSRYSPRRSESIAAARRALVLGRMVEEGFLSPEVAEGYSDDPVLLPPTGEVRVTGAAYITEVRRAVRDALGREAAGRLGLVVRTAYDPEAQYEAEAAVVEAVRAVNTRQGARGVARTLAPTEWDGFLDRAPGLGLEPTTGTPVPPVPGDCFSALVTDEGLDALRVGPYRFPLSEAARTTQLRREDGSGASQARWLLGPGDVLGVCLDGGGHVILDPTAWAQGAAVVLENSTGRVLALVGGTGTRLEGFVRATQARRQPGSAFKPIVYAAALQGGRSQLAMISAKSVRLPGAGGVEWRAHESLGLARVRMGRALALSSNGAAVRLLLEQGAEEVSSLAARMGVRSALRRDATLALGSSEVTPMDMAAAYLTVARGGLPREPSLVTSIEDVKGATVARAGEPFVLPGGSAGRLPGAIGERALAPGVAYELTEMLEEVVRAGTGRAAAEPGFARAGKTGTTNGSVDAWFAGFTPRYTVVVWIGPDDHASLGPGESGARTALPAWLAIVRGLDQPPGEPFAVPADVVMLRDEAGVVRGVRRGTAPPELLPLRGLPAGPLAAFPGTVPFD